MSTGSITPPAQPSHGYLDERHVEDRCAPDKEDNILALSSLYGSICRYSPRSLSRLDYKAYLQALKNIKKLCSSYRQMKGSRFAVIPLERNWTFGGVSKEEERMRSAFDQARAVRADYVVKIDQKLLEECVQDYPRYDPPSNPEIEKIQRTRTVLERLRLLSLKADLIALSKQNIPIEGITSVDLLKPQQEENNAYCPLRQRQENLATTFDAPRRNNQCLNSLSSTLSELQKALEELLSKLSSDEEKLALIEAQEVLWAQLLGPEFKGMLELLEAAEKSLLDDPESPAQLPSEELTKLASLCERNLDDLEAMKEQLGPKKTPAKLKSRKERLTEAKEATVRATIHFFYDDDRYDREELGRSSENSRLLERFHQQRRLRAENALPAQSKCCCAIL